MQKNMTLRSLIGKSERKFSKNVGGENIMEIIKSEKGEIIAIIVRSDYDNDGVTFFTPDSFSQQLAYMHHPVGHIILPHVHNEVRREVYYTKETLIIRKGHLRCDLYSDDRKYQGTVNLQEGDVILLASGGHGFLCETETEFLEIKQGPYVGEGDKTRFEPYDGEIVIKDISGKL